MYFVIFVASSVLFANENIFYQQLDSMFIHKYLVKYFIYTVLLNILANIKYIYSIGIAFYKGVYRLPADQQERRQALTMLVSAIVKHDLQGQNSQISVWQNLKDEFDQCIADSAENTTTSTKFVGDKKLLRPTVKKALDSLTHLIKGNYPDSYENTLRTWGFLKETY